MLYAIFQEPLDESLAVQAVHEAFKFGINFFDTSPYYGLTRSEKVSQQMISASSKPVEDNFTLCLIENLAVLDIEGIGHFAGAGASSERPAS